MKREAQLWQVLRRREYRSGRFGPWEIIAIVYSNKIAWEVAVLVVNMANYTCETKVVKN
jgi:hypothetical protein